MNGLRAGGRKGLRVGGLMITEISESDASGALLEGASEPVSVNGSKLNVCVVDDTARAVASAEPATRQASTPAAAATIKRLELSHPIMRLASDSSSILTLLGEESSAIRCRYRPNHDPSPFPTLPMLRSDAPDGAPEGYYRPQRSKVRQSFGGRMVNISDYNLMTYV
jgi:hypothetical protein